MIRWILIGVLSLGIAGVSVWGYQEHQDKNAILIQAENTYQRSFHELTYNIDLLHDTIGSSLAMNSSEQLSPQLAEIWRITSLAHNNVGQLPLTLIPFNKTEEFLSKMGDFSYKVAVRDLNKSPLSDEEIDTLHSLYEMSGEIEQELRRVQNMALENNLRWMDVQLALVNNDETADNTIIDGFKTVEKTVEGYSEANFNETLLGVSTAPDEGYKTLTGKEITEKEAERKIQKLLSVNGDTDITVTETGEGANVALYSGSFQEDGVSGYVDISKKGGHPFTVMVSRELNDAEISLHDALNKADEYMEEQGFSNFSLLASNQYDTVGVFHYIPEEDNVLIYPDAIQIKVALDNGDVLGFVAKDYYQNYKKREIPEPGVSEDEALKQVNPNLEIQDKHMGIIKNDMGEEILAYVFLGTLNDDTYKIFINASDGSEERVEKLKKAEMKYS
ncbi:spore germination protein [Gracilibacillus halotolerans]|uniref:Spore germination protein n=1 Tax=Gracilibacillus halotolerans TaxID=74386 RepID=A0A841RCJ7_9BACI|nr:germination protein YpeB [Gracilibacillus halotolerans]MBB6511670.1 spore germination protein [Gracilibacillus halotolerans]